MDRYMDMSSWWRRIDRVSHMRRVFHHRVDFLFQQRLADSVESFQKVGAFIIVFFFSLKSFVF